MNVAADHDVPIPYMQRTREYYLALGYDNPYRWAHHVDVPFTLLAKPLAECTVGLVTTSEMVIRGREAELEARLRDDPDVAALFAAAFPGQAEPVTLDNVTRALAAFERTLVSGGSAYDRLVYQGEMDALSQGAWRGLRLFFSDRTGCASCHGGLLFSGGFDYDRLERPAPPRFFDNGLLEASERRGPAARDPGLARATGRRRDRGLFKTPTLRNIAVTAPYMHDGRIATLEAVLDHYARPESPHPQGGGVPLQPSEREDLLEFLRSLTDEAFLADPSFGDAAADRATPGRAAADR